MQYDIIVKSRTKGVEFKILADDAVSNGFKKVIESEHYFYNPALIMLQSIDQGKEWKETIEYPVSVDPSFLTGKVLFKDRFSEDFEDLDLEYFQLIYVPKTNNFTLLNLGYSSYDFDFLFLDQIQREF
jgi:hypothetical protein